MARRALAQRQQPDAQLSWATPRCHIFAAGYSTPKPNVLSRGLAVLLHLPEGGGAPSQSPLSPLVRGVQQLLIGPAEGASPDDGAPLALAVLDLTPLCPDPAAAAAALDAEGASAALTKSIGKPVARALEKLTAGVSDVTLVAAGGCAQLAVKLLRAADGEHGIKAGALSRLLLLQPRLPAACVNRHLSGAAAAPGGAATTLANALATSRLDTPRLDAVFESEEALSRRLPVLRGACPSGAREMRREATRCDEM